MTTATRPDWRDLPAWSDDNVFCTHWATATAANGEPSGAVVRCSKAIGHKGSHRSEWVTE